MQDKKKELFVYRSQVLLTMSVENQSLLIGYDFLGCPAQDELSYGMSIERCERFADRYGRKT